MTGMSGAGKSTTMKMLEDAGYYCVDNLPVSLIEQFAELVNQPNTELTKVALGIDVRSGAAFRELPGVMERISNSSLPVEILFLDAADDRLIKRYKETRRVHPLSPEGRVEDGVKKEREILSEIRKSATYVLDTTNLLTRELKEELEKIFVENREYNNLMVTVLSFGFKHGIPADADLVFDVRFLPNPFYIEELKHKTGLDQEVRDYVLQFDEAGEFLDQLEKMIRFLIPNYIKEGKYSLVIGIGCTGGKHRSVTLANELYNRLKQDADYGIKLQHRDVSIAGK